MRIVCKDVTAETLYDVLHDTSYRKKWDSNMIDTFDIGRLTVNADVGYYSCESLLCLCVRTEHQYTFIIIIKPIFVLTMSKMLWVFAVHLMINNFNDKFIVVFLSSNNSNVVLFDILCMNISNTYIKSIKRHTAILYCNRYINHFKKTRKLCF